MTTAILIQDDNQTILECVKTSSDNYQITIPTETGLVCVSLTKNQAIDFREYLKETLSQVENW